MHLVRTGMVVERLNGFVVHVFEKAMKTHMDFQAIYTNGFGCTDREATDRCRVNAFDRCV